MKNFNEFLNESSNDNVFKDFFIETLTDDLDKEENQNCVNYEKLTVVMKENPEHIICIQLDSSDYDGEGIIKAVFGNLIEKMDHVIKNPPAGVYHKSVYDRGLENWWKIDDMNFDETLNQWNDKHFLWFRMRDFFKRIVDDKKLLAFYINSISDKDKQISISYMKDFMKLDININKVLNDYRGAIKLTKYNI